MAKFARDVVLSLVAGALFGWAMSTKFTPTFAVGSGAAAAALMYGGTVYNGRAERREAMRRQEEFTDEI